jgi:predicted deacylase/putative intracellular protease/amidase
MSVLPDGLASAWGSRLAAALIAVVPLAAGAATPAAAVAGASEQAAPAGVIAPGTPAATPYYVCDSGVAGPTVVVTGGLHGDEPAGACAADQIRRWPITRGKLVVLPRANAVALQAGKRLTPGAEASENNLNRNFPHAASDAPARGALAQALWEFVRQQRPAWLVDLHEGRDFSGQTNTSVGSSVIVFPTREGQAAAAAMQAAVNASITNSARSFTLRNPPIDGSLARAAGAHLGAHALIAETTVKGQPQSFRSRQHRVMVHALLKRLEMVDAASTPELLSARGEPHATLRLAIYDGRGTGGVGGRRVEEQVGKREGACVYRVCSEDICEGALDGFDVLVVPGGNASSEAAALGRGGLDRIRKFVEAGGGYIGICAGAYLATSGGDQRLKILDAKTVSPKWERGHATVQLELTEQGRRVFGDRRGEVACKYANGPCLCPAGLDAVPDYEVLAHFRSEVSENGTPPGVMIGSPAIVAGRYGKGRVMSISPHPEQTQGLETLIPQAVAWVAGQDGDGKR